MWIKKWQITAEVVDIGASRGGVIAAEFLQARVVVVVLRRTGVVDHAAAGEVIPHFFQGSEHLCGTTLKARSTFAQALRVLGNPVELRINDAEA